MTCAAYVGIDPGATGGIAILYEVGGIVAYKMPDTEHDLWELFQVIAASEDRFAYIERVAARPGQGVSSTFKFGQNYGMLRAMLCASKTPFEAVTPGKWQRTLGCLSKGDKNVTKRKAQELFPHANTRITHATADAILIAEYGRRVRQLNTKGATR